MVLAFGLLATIVSIPIGGLGARGLQSLFINLLNLEDPGFAFDYSAVAVQVAVSMFVPVLAAVFPLLSGVRISVREAINTYGLVPGPQFALQYIAGLEQCLSQPPAGILHRDNAGFGRDYFYDGDRRK